MGLNEEKNAFAVASSLLLELGRESFPTPFSIDKDVILKFADGFGLTVLIELDENAIKNTANWLALEKYIHKIDEETFVLAEKSFNDVGFKITEPSARYRHFSRVDNGELFFVGSSDGWNSIGKLKLQGVAKRFIYNLSEN